MSFLQKSSDRKVSWLELFFDLVFVALIAQLTYHFSHHHHTLEDFMQVGLVGYMIFFAWIGTTANRNLRKDEDIIDIICIQFQMLLIMVMSLTLTQAFGVYSWLFFSAMAFNGFISLFMIRRFYNLHPNKRPQTLNVWWGLFTAACLWGLTGFIPLPYLYVAAGCALLTNMFAASTTGKNNKVILLDMDHLLERLGLFLLMVMGEAVLVVALANSVAKEFDLFRLTIVLSGLLIMIALWWLYFPYIDTHAKGQRAKWFQVMLQTHGFLYGSLILIAAGLKIIIENPQIAAEKTWIFLAGMALMIITFNIIRSSLTHHIAEGFKSTLDFLLPLGVITISCIIWQIPAFLVVAATAVLMLAYVFCDYKKHFGNKAVIH